MKDKKSILKVVTVIITLLLISCNGSVKGKWSEVDKEKFRKDMASVEELSNFGDKKTEWIECYLSKCESHFSSYEEADTDESGCKIIALQCSSEVLSNGSVLGNWSDSDKEKFREVMESVDELSNLGELKSDWIDCYLSKCESNYASFQKADSDKEGCKKMALECYDEVN
jgi:hypothetical protein